MTITKHGAHTLITYAVGPVLAVYALAVTVLLAWVAA